MNHSVIDNIQELKIMGKNKLESHTKIVASWRLSTATRREERKEDKKIGASHNYSLIFVDDPSNLILKLRKQ